jgi:hypothetical protein
MTSLSSQIESTKERLTREQKRLLLGTERARKALRLAVREEAASWQLYVTTEQRRVSEALSASVALLRSQVGSRAGVERVVLRAADRALADAHTQVKQRLSRIDRELTADATPVESIADSIAVVESTAGQKSEPSEKRVRARRPTKK